VTREAAALNAFWSRLERLRVEDMLALAARPLDAAAHAEALGRAADAAEQAGLTDTIAEATVGVDDWVVRLFNRSTSQPGWYEANWGRPGSTGDRANLAASLSEVVVALVLGDRIDDADRDELLGAWGDPAA
jgi:hypothetical protein